VKKEKKTISITRSGHLL